MMELWGTGVPHPPCGEYNQGEDIKDKDEKEYSPSSGEDDCYCQKQKNVYNENILYKTP